MKRIIVVLGMICLAVASSAASCQIFVNDEQERQDVETQRQLDRIQREAKEQAVSTTQAPESVMTDEEKLHAIKAQLNERYAKVGESAPKWFVAIDKIAVSGDTVKATGDTPGGRMTKLDALETCKVISDIILGEGSAWGLVAVEVKNSSGEVLWGQADAKSGCR